MDKSLGTILHFWGVFWFTQAQPLRSPHKQCWTRVSRIFSEFQLCIGWGGGRTTRKFRKGCTVLRGNQEMTEKYEYCSTVPRKFVQDCSSKNVLMNSVDYSSSVTWVPPKKHHLHVRQVKREFTNLIATSLGLSDISFFTWWRYKK